MRKALNSVDNHLGRILQRWTSSHSNARLESLNGLFQAARARARGYRNTTTFATMIYLIAAPWETSCALGNDVLALGLGVTPPWKLVGQRLRM